MACYLDVIAAEKVRPSTLVRYRQLVRNQLVPKLGDHRLDRLQLEHIERAYPELLASGPSRRSESAGHRAKSSHRPFLSRSAHSTGSRVRDSAASHCEDIAGQVSDVNDERVPIRSQRTRQFTNGRRM